VHLTKSFSEDLTVGGDFTVRIFFRQPKPRSVPGERRISRKFCVGRAVNYPETKFIFFLLTRMNAVSYASHPLKLCRVLPITF
jgi:hypothetical protein